MSKKKMREEFEAEYKTACLSRAVPRFDSSVFAKDHCDDYLSSLVQSAWWGWQASRDSLVIELPPKWPLQTSADHAANEMREQCVSAIEYGASLKVAP